MEASAPGLEILPAGEDVEWNQYLWLNRVLVVFSDTPADPRFVKQMQMIEERPRDLLERDVIVVTDTRPFEKRAPTCARSCARAVSRWCWWTRTAW